MTYIARVTTARFDAVDGALALSSPYSAELVAGIKALPYAARKWDASSRRWLIAPSHAATVAALVQDTLGQTITIPDAAPAAAPSVRVVRLDYLGACKDRGDGTKSATGHSAGAWSLAFPESALRAWFQDELEIPATATEQPAPKAKTLYAELAIKPDADASAIKAAYRRMARQWHPDVCAEADATERFHRIKYAYEILGTEQTRKRYTAGLKFAAHAEKCDRAGKRSDAKWAAFEASIKAVQIYRAPLRCGLLIIEGIPQVGMFVVSNILKWDDITNSDGQTLVSSWPQDGDTFIQAWV